MGAEGLPDGFLDPVLRALVTLPSEDDRLAALAVLRRRGTLEGVQAALEDAYRREPSRRVAQEIAETLRELAYR
jgi:hypothetical protein